MATLNPFDILGADNNDDPLQLMAAAAVVTQKVEVKKAATTPAGKGTQAPRL
jgi:plasminogen activator inhibitor 1 RNA-binding protein